MEIGAFFILVIVLVVVVGLGAAVYAIAATLRHKELSPDAAAEPEAERRPVHHEVENEQNTHFVGTP